MPWRDLAIVDVELLVQDGAPRRAFTLEGTDPHPTWSLDLELLQQLGWEIGLTGSLSPPPGPVDPTVPHPFELGPMWAGAGVWRSTFCVTGREVRCAVAHELLERFDDGSCDAGPSLDSGSPWQWRIDGLDDAPRCGRAENPLQAALHVEELLARSDADAFEATQARRLLRF
jgi:hypothetical protein